jgi:hypothetical protein
MKFARGNSNLTTDVATGISATAQKSGIIEEIASTRTTSAYSANLPANLPPTSAATTKLLADLFGPARSPPPPKKNVEEKRADARMYHLRSKFPEEQVTKVLRWEIAQAGICEICGEPETVKRRGKLLRLAWDHDHETGRFRGLLCLRCNTLLHRTLTPELLVRMAQYLGWDLSDYLE